MLLFAHAVGLPQPRAYFVVNVPRFFQPEVVNMVAWRNCLNLTKSRAFEATRQDNMGVQATIGKFIGSGEDHSNLKADPRLRRRHQNGAYGLQFIHQRAVEFDLRSRTIAQEILFRSSCARMRLIAVCKISPAFSTFPQVSSFRVHWLLRQGCVCPAKASRPVSAIDLASQRRVSYSTEGWMSRTT
jgi:hypothetical protein